MTAAPRSGTVWSWPRAVDAIRGHPSAGTTPRLRLAEVIHREVDAEARGEARL